MEDKKNIFIELTNETLDQDKCYKFVHSEISGGVVVFTGVVRNNGNQKEVIRLEYSAYQEMAVKEIRKVINNGFTKYPIHKVAIQHRLGILAPGEQAVIIAVSSAHRKEAFKACHFMIDDIKKTVPIWKKEVYQDGSEWIGSGP